MGSSRLPGKVLKMLGDRCLLEHILYRLKFLRHEVDILVATTTLEQDDDIEVFCQKHKTSCFRGSESDVLKRYYFCAKKYNFDHIVRLTGDNPFVDIGELDNLIDLHLDTNADYSRSLMSLPRGVGSEIFSFAALEKSYLYGKKDNHKEHVNEYIEEHESKFNISNLSVIGIKKSPEVSLTVDTKSDYEKACFIVEQSNNEYVTTEEAVELCLQYA